MCNLKNQRKNTSPSITDVKVCVSSVSYLTEAAHMADKKDSEKKAFNWKVVGTASFVVLTAIGIGTAAWGGNFNIKLPKQSSRVYIIIIA